MKTGNKEHLLSHQFHGSGIWEVLSQVSHKAAIEMLAEAEATSRHLGGSASKFTHEPLRGLSHNIAAEIPHSEHSKRKLRSSGQISHYNLISEVISHHLVMFCLFKVSYWVCLTLKRRSFIRAGEAGINAAILEAAYHNA